MGLLAEMTWGQWLLAVLTILVCFLLVVVILLQKGRGGGLAGAFGGAGGTSAFGAKTGDVFTWITVVMTGVFVLLAVMGNYAFDQSAAPKPVVPAALEPAEGEEPVGIIPSGEPGRIELGTTDPTTGKRSTTMVPVTVGEGGTLVPINVQPGATPPPPTAAEPAPKPPEATPEKKPDEEKPATP